MTNYPVKPIPGAGLLKGTAYVVVLLLAVPAWINSSAWLYVSRGFDISLGDTGTLSFTIGSGHLLACLIAGWLFKRFGAGSTLLIGSLLALVAAIGYVIAPTWGVIVAFGLLQGAGNGLIFVGLIIYFTTRFGTRPLVWLFMCYTARELIIWSLNTTEISFQLSWQIGYLLAVLVFGIIVVLFVATRLLWNITWFGDETNEPIRVGNILGLSPVWLAIALFLILGGLELTGSSFWPLLFGIAISNLEFDALMLWKGISSVLPVVSLFAVGWMANRINWRWVLRFCAAGLVVGTGLSVWTLTVWTPFISYTVRMIAIAFLFPGLLIHIKQYIPPIYLPIVIGWLVAATSIGQDTVSRILSSSLSTTIHLIAVLTLTVLLVAIFEFSVWFNAPKKKKGIPERPLEEPLPE